MRLAVLWNTSAPVLSIERRWVRSGSAAHSHMMVRISSAGAHGWCAGTSMRRVVAGRTQHALPVVVATVELRDEAAVAVTTAACVPREDVVVAHAVVRALGLRPRAVARAMGVKKATGRERPAIQPPRQPLAHAPAGLQRACSRTIRRAVGWSGVVRACTRKRYRTHTTERWIGVSVAWQWQ